MHHKTVTNLLISIASLLPLLCSSTPNFSACWGFGGYEADTGNNNFLPTYVRANFPPYGRDLPSGIPRGRFSNGRLPLDFVCSSLGFKNFTPPYLNTTFANDQELMTGVSFASGGVGYDPLTIIYTVLSLSKQIDLFEKALKRLRRSSGVEMTNAIVENSLFVVIAGSIDFASYYDLRIRSVQYNISGYQDFVLQQVESIIRRLYAVGARKFFMSNLPAIGCIPIQNTFTGNITRRDCIRQQNEDSVAYNKKFGLLLSRLEQVLTSSRIATYDFFNLTLDASTNPTKYGFEESRRSCCGTGLFEVGLTCSSSPLRTCSDPSEYVYWDAISPGDAFNKILGDDALRQLNLQFS